MTITIVCDVLGEENNGTTLAAMNLVRFLRSRGHTVRILCADQSKKGLPDYFVVPNKSFGKYLDAYVSKVGVSLADPDPDIIRAALAGADDVHIMLPLFLANASVKIADEMGIPVTAGFHMQAENMTNNVHLENSKLASKFVYHYIWKHVYSHCQCIHYPTQFIRDVFEGSIKKHTPGYVISNGVNSYVKRREVSKPAELKDKFVILTVGRYSAEKSQETLIEAVKYSKYKDKIQLILAGQGTREKEYRKLAEDLPNQPIFKLFDRYELVDVENYSDMYVHPAVAELEGIACLEAIACGKLTLVSDSKRSATKGFAVDPRCIFKEKDPRDLARLIDYWIEHPEEAREIEEKYWQEGQTFDQEKCMEQMEQMFRDAISRHSQEPQRRSEFRLAWQRLMM